MSGAGREASGSGARERARLAFARARASGGEAGGADAVPPPPDPVAMAVMNDALLRLSRRERAVFLATRVAGLSIEEIAERMGLPSEKVLRIFVRAFGNLERNLANPRRHWWRRWIVWICLQGWRRWWHD